MMGRSTTGGGLVATISYTGTIQWQPDPEPFGDVYAEQQVGPGHDPLIRYPGQWRVDPVLSTTEPAFTTLYYNTHRWYNPSWGRYTQSDPLGLKGGLNLFRYAYGNPLRFIDPMGLWGVGPGPCGSRPECCDRDSVGVAAENVVQQLGRMAQGYEPIGGIGGSIVVTYGWCLDNPEYICPHPTRDFNPDIPGGQE